MKRLSIRPLVAGTYRAAILLLGLGAIVNMVSLPHQPNWGAFTIILLLACGTTPLQVRLPGIDRSVSLSVMFTFAAITEQPPSLAFVIAAAAHVFGRLCDDAKDEPWREISFHLAAVAMSILFTSNVYRYLTDEMAMEWLLASGVAAATYYLVSTTASALRIGVIEQTYVWKVWNKKFFWTGPVYMVAPIGVGITKLLLHSTLHIDTLLALSIILAGYFYLKIYFARLHDRQDHARTLAYIRERALETLAVAIEAKDGSTAGHLQRVKLYATRLARKLGCSDQEIRTLELAAVLHDVGKVGVPDYILKKPGRLTKHEFGEIANHTAIGAGIVSAMHFPEPVDEVVFSHHEHWDGSGYPRRLFGPEIPRLARILTVVDCFDALISDRPYREAMPIDKAIELLRQQRGRIFDPKILDSFLEQLPSYLEELERNIQRDRSQPGREKEPAVAIKQTWISEGEEHEVLRRHRALRKLADAPERLLAFYDILHVLGADLNFDKGLKECLRILRKAIPCDKTGILVLEPGKYVLLEADGIPEHCISRLSLSPDDGPIALAAAYRRPIAADAPPSEVPGSPVRRYLEDVKTTLAAPLVANERVVGSIILCRTEDRPFDAEQKLFLSLITGKLGSTLSSYRTMQKVSLEAQTDEITNLPNARAAFRRLEAELQRAQREGQTVGVLFMDINGLKPVNDSYGHGAGDKLLAEIGSKLKKSLRAYDFVGRVGGDEFLAILPGISKDALPRMTEFLKKTLAETPIQVADQVYARTAISIGGALYPTDGADPEELVNVSDQRMYRDKQQARPPVNVEQPLPSLVQ